MYNRRLIKYLIYLLLIPYPLLLCAQQDSGFTDKSEAKNLKVNGLKEGKWVEYFKIKYDTEIHTKSSHAPIYYLTDYKAGKPTGLVHGYYNKSGKLYSETPYVNGNKNGIMRKYYENGELMIVDTIIDGKESGVIKTYYESGKLYIECPFIRDKVHYGNLNCYGKLKSEQNNIHANVKGVPNGVTKFYYESGKLKTEYYDINGQTEGFKNYDENGNEVK